MILLFLRPWFWLPTLAAAIAGYLWTHPAPNTLELVLVTMAAAGLSAAAEGINEIADREIDRHAEGARMGIVRLSSGSGALVSGRVSVRGAWWIVASCAAIALLAAALLSVVSLAASVLILILAWSYSARPLRLKRWGLAGFFAHALGYGPLSTGIGAGSAISDPSIAAWSIFVGLWVGTTGLTSDLLDIETDHAAGVKTLPVLLGRRGATLMIAAGSALVLGTGSIYLIREMSTPPTLLAVLWATYLVWIAALLRSRTRPLPAPVHVGTLVLEAAFPFMVLL